MSSNFMDKLNNLRVLIDEKSISSDKIVYQTSLDAYTQELISLITNKLGSKADSSALESINKEVKSIQSKLVTISEDEVSEILRSIT